MLLPACTSYGELVLRFSDDGGNTFKTNFTGNPNSNFSVGLYLVDTDGVGGILEQEGLFSFALAGQVTSGNSGVISGATSNPVFDAVGVNNGFTATSVELQAGVLFNIPPVGPEVLLGTFEFDAVSNGTTSIEWGDLVPGSGTTADNWLTGSNNLIDDQIFGVGSNDVFVTNFVVTSIPEPSTMLMFSAVMVHLLGRRKRRQV